MVRAASTSIPKAWPGRCSPADRWRALIAPSARNRSPGRTRRPASNASRAGRCTACPGPSSRGSTTRAVPTTPTISGSIVYNTLGLGEDVPIAIANGSESLLALVNGKFVDIRIPYPLGFFSQERRWPDRRSESRLEGPCVCGRHQARAPTSIAKAARTFCRKSSRCRCVRIRWQTDAVKKIG